MLVYDVAADRVTHGREHLSAPASRTFDDDTDHNETGLLAPGSNVWWQRFPSMKRFPGVSTTLCLLFVLVGAHAAAPDPAEVVRTTTDEVLSRVQSERDQLSDDPSKMYSLVSETIFPHFDFGIMSQWVLGKHWTEADDSVRTNFVEQFRRLLVRTYATALLEFSNQEITYPPIEQRGSANTALVKQQVSQPGGGSLPIIYRLHNKTGDWKVFDVSVDGVSLVKTYRASFGSMIKNDGLDGLINSLNAKNEQYANK